MVRKARFRALALCALLAAVFSVFSCRLVYLQICCSHAYTEMANQAQTYKVTIPARRGSILDIHGEVLASEMPLCRVVADGSHIKPALLPAVRTLLADSLSLDAAMLGRKLTADRRYLVLKHQVPTQEAEELKAALGREKTGGVYFEPDSERIYPNGPLLCHVVGFTDNEGHGIQGVEKTMNRYLEGQPGYRYITRDRAGVELVQKRGVEQDARHGSNVQLTIDLGLQSIVEQELDAAVKRYAPETATAIFMRPRTGEIVAMASRPYFDINERATA